jgi:hypothetical protein
MIRQRCKHQSEKRRRALLPTFPECLKSRRRLKIRRRSHPYCLFSPSDNRAPVMPRPRLARALSAAAGGWRKRSRRRRPRMGCSDPQRRSAGTRALEQDPLCQASMHSHTRTQGELCQRRGGPSCQGRWENFNQAAKCFSAPARSPPPMRESI